MELLISRVLRYGVLLCGLILAIGIVMTFLDPGQGDLLTTIRAGNDAALGSIAPRTVSDLVAGLSAHDPNAVIALGLIMLIGLPIVRVGLTTALFVRERDWVYVGITTIVLGILVVGILLGKEL